MKDGNDGLDFVVRKKDWRECRFVSAAVPGDLAPEQVLFRVDRFAFTANNISYALAGDLLGYWKFFPTEEGWGRLPVMGFGEVIRSAHPEVSEGERPWRVVPDDQLFAEAEAVAARIAELPTNALVDFKRISNRACYLDVEGAMALETEATIRGTLDPDSAALIKQFSR